jgi:hypothetical protein
MDRPASALASMAAPNGAAPTALPLPFILIQVNPEASVEIQIADDNRQAMFDFAGCADADSWQELTCIACSTLAHTRLYTWRIISPKFWDLLETPRLPGRHLCRTV